jgi:hypothetical protein
LLGIVETSPNWFVGASVCNGDVTRRSLAIVQDSTGERLKCVDVALAKGLRARRKNLENPKYFSTLQQGKHQDRADPQLAAGEWIHSGVNLGVAT